ncbi:MAG: 3-deoxy-manno-octulosonate cytidylyltransferase [Rhodospirillaceae bacterium]|nr:3-deoxy-manno-octulosonate cytidylyltransferase [Rhodospirillaceae bacterium]
MSLPINPIILIPARMQSARLPNKPLADINGIPMIVHVWKRALEAQLGRVIVACGELEIANAIEEEGGEAVLTDPNLPSGSDRIFAALNIADPQMQHDAVINVQGDLPVLATSTIVAAYHLLDNTDVDIGTVAAEIVDDSERTTPSVVKVIVAWDTTGFQGKALYFTRAPAPTGDGPMYHHIGLYAYQRHAIERFVKLPLSKLEQQEQLEQLRAIENGMRIDVALVDTIPFGVDTPQDLAKARILMK